MNNINIVGFLVLSTAIIIHGVLSFYSNKPMQITIPPATTNGYLLQSVNSPASSPPPMMPDIQGRAEGQQFLTNTKFSINPSSPNIVSEQKTTWGNNRIILAGFTMNGKSNRITVKPGETIHGSSFYVYDCPTCQSGSINQIIVGIKNIGAQACIYNGGTSGNGAADFTLIAPMKPGTYAVRFRYAQANGCSDALAKWWNMDNPPPASSTVGEIIVK